MTKKFSARICLAAATLALAGQAQATATVGVVNSRADLDLNGNFTYAVTMNASANGLSLNDATFSYGLGGTPGFSVAFQNYIDAWHPTTGNGSDASLNAVVSDIVWNWNGPQNGGLLNPLTFTMGGLTVGESYKVQLVSSENCCARGFDIWQDGQLIADNFSVYQLAGRGGGTAFVSNTFVATATSVTFAMGGVYSQMPDNNPVLNAVTLEHIAAPVPEPTTAGLLLAGLAVVGASARRRQIRAR